MATIRIRIVASADASLQNVFKPLTTEAARARKAIGEQLAAGAAEGAHPYRSLPAKIKPAFDGIEKGAKGAGLALGTMADGASKRFALLSADLKKLPVELRVVAQEAQRELAKIERAQAREALGLGGTKPAALRSLQRSPYAREFSAAAHLAGRIGSNALSFGSRLGGDLVRGIGVNTDLSSMFAQQVSLESMATQLSNSAYMPGDARNGQRVDPRELVSQARGIGERTASDPSHVLEGLQAFVGKTGDLATGSDALERLAVLSKATGTNLKDMVDAAGDVSNVLGDVPDKGTRVYEVMKAVAGQGKLGAVEIRDMAKQMAKVAAGAQMFEGDRSTNIAILGAIAQESRQRGGSASATQAATSVSSFVNTFSKSARLGAFKGFGVEVHGDSGLRDARSIILESLAAAMHGGSTTTAMGKHKALPGGTKNFSENMGAMFADVRARSAVRGFESIFQEAYAGSHGNEQAKLAAGTRAVSEEFDRLQRAAMSEAEIAESFKRAMGTTESQVQSFNNQISAVASDVEAELLPALVGLAPAAVELAVAFRGMVTWLADNGVLGKKGQKKVEGEIARANVLSTATGAIAAGMENEGGLYLDPATGEWKRRAGTQVPKGLPGQVDESAAAIAKEVAAARAKEDELRKGFGHDGAGYDDAQLKRIAGGKPARDFERAPNESEQADASAVLAASDERRGKERDLEMANQIATAMQMALATGRISVVIEEDKTKVPNPVRADTNSKAPAEAEP